MMNNTIRYFNISLGHEQTFFCGLFYFPRVNVSLMSPSLLFISKVMRVSKETASEPSDLTFVKKKGPAVKGSRFCECYFAISLIHTQTHPTQVRVPLIGFQ